MRILLAVTMFSNPAHMSRDIADIPKPIQGLPPIPSIKMAAAAVAAVARANNDHNALRKAVLARL